MTRVTAAQQRLFDNAVLIAAIRLLFDRMRELYPCPILRDVVTIHNGQGLLADDRSEVGPYEVYAAGGLVGHHSVPLSTDPFVVIGRKGSAGKSTFAAKGGWVIDTAYYAQPNDSALDTKYLHYALLSLDFTDDIISTAIPGINRTAIYRHPIPLPPIAIQRAVACYLDAAESHAREVPALPDAFQEQRRTVARIEEMAAKIEEARGLRREATGEAIALFSSAMNGVWKNQTGWKEKSLGELAATVSGQIDPRVEPYASLPHINGEAIESGTCKLLPYRLAKEDGVTSGKYHFGAGAVLYSKIRPYLRKAVQVPVEGICSADVYAFDSVDAALEPRFLMYSLVSPDFTSYANRLSGRTRMPKLNQKQLFVYKLRYPSRLEQKEFVSYLDRLQVKVDVLKQAQAETAAELDALLPSVLDRAFSGQL